MAGCFDMEWRYDSTAQQLLYDIAFVIIVIWNIAFVEMKPWIQGMLQCTYKRCDFYER